MAQSVEIWQQPAGLKRHLSQAAPLKTLPAFKVGCLKTVMLSLTSVCVSWAVPSVFPWVSWTRFGIGLRYNEGGRMGFTITNA